MPRAAQHAVTWRRETEHYELSSGGTVGRAIRRDDADAWQSWLVTVRAFAFQGAAGSVGVRREARARGGVYWHAYRSVGGRTRKQYLGATETVTLARLEDVALALATTPDTPAVDGGGGARPRVPDVGAGALPATKLLPPHPQVAMVWRERL